MTARGEGTLTVDGSPVDILFTNRALAQAEVQLGRPVLQIAGDAENLGMGDLARLMLVGMNAARRDAKTGGKPPNLNDAWDAMDAVGFKESLRVVIEALAAVLGYSQDDDGEEIDEDPPE